jgi:hypothetical protein
MQVARVAKNIVRDEGVLSWRNKSILANQETLPNTLSPRGKRHKCKVPATKLNKSHLSNQEDSQSLGPASP